MVEVQVNQVPEEAVRKTKKTNYQRLYRKSKKMEVLTHNFAESVINVTRKFIKDKEAREGWEKMIAVVRKEFNKQHAQL